jgi:hypothetical protein
LINILQRAAIETAYVQKCPEAAVSFIELALHLDPKSRELLYHAAVFINGISIREGIETAKLSHSLSVELPEIIFANYLIIKGYLSAGGTYGKTHTP